MADTPAPARFRRVSAFLGWVVTFSACTGSPAEPPAQRTFATPDEAAQALARAVLGDDTTALLDLMGPESRAVILPSDRVQAARDRQVVAAAMTERWWLEGTGDSARTLVMGNESWPFPIPIVKTGDAWAFDLEAGREEVLHRRIGANELAVMEVARSFVDAQREYASVGRDGNARGVYAQRFVSEPGRQDGLFWPVSSPDSAASPMGELAAQAAADGYRKSGTGPTAYHGYYFKVLTAQGPSAPGGERSYLQDGLMRGGFAMLAWPADYGQSGIMTFMIGQDRVLRQKDLGAGTDSVAKAIVAFDPDSTWTRPEDDR
jgi:hypothetical protein